MSTQSTLELWINLPHPPTPIADGGGMITVFLQPPFPKINPTTWLTWLRLGFPEQPWTTDVMTARVFSRHQCWAELVAWCDGVPIGGVTLHRTDQSSVAKLHWLVVAPAWRGRGLGRRITVTAMREAERAGFHHLMLRTEPWREAAVRLYNDLGFEKRQTQP